MGLTRFTVDGWTGYLGAPWTTDGDGCDWHVTAEAGWRGSPAPRVDRVNRARRDGEVDPGQTWLTGRLIELSGVVVAPTHTQLAAGMERFAAILSDGFLTPLVVDEDGLIRLANVRRSDHVDVEWKSPTSASWSLALFAPDPLKYDSDALGGGEISANTGLPAATAGLVVPADVPWVVSSGGTQGRLTITNSGRAPLRPTFTINGPVTNPRIEHTTTGRVLDMVIAIDAAHAVTVHVDTGEILLDEATSVRNALLPTSSPVTAMTLPVGENEYFFRALSSPGGATLVVTTRPGAYY